MKNFVGLLFIISSALFGYYMWMNYDLGIFIVLAIILGAYMAMNIWANDVANNVWPAVWSKAINMKWALVIAALWEFSWAVIAWWDVVKTIKKWIIDISNFSDPNMFIFAMLAALLAAALWLNLATYLKAPVSTTHSIVWGVMWAWIAAFWVSIVSWWTMWKIAASWVISPVLWWLIAAIFLFCIKMTIIYQDDKVKQAKKWIPLYVSIMWWAFTTYLILKWLKHLIKVDFITAASIGIIIAWIIFAITRTYLNKTKKLKNNRESVNLMFTIPLIFSVLLLSFAHWANDVANAIWPIAWIYDAVISWHVSAKVGIQTWILVLGWLWITFWLALYWPRIIKTVWNEITELDRVRAFSIALAAAITVIIASQLGLPVSSTHIALGWIFWVWFLREWLDRKTKKPEDKYVKRELIWKIIAAWVITVPVVAFISGMIFMLFNNLFIIN